MSPIYSLRATPIKETDKAVLFITDIHDEEVWVPKAVIDDSSEVWKEGQEEGDLVIKRWWAKKEGWCDE